MVGTFLEPSRGRRLKPIQSIPYSVAQPLERGSTYRHKAYYSLDRDDGLEHEAVFVALSPHELYERKVTMQELHAAISSLPDKQAKRIYAHFILGMTKQDIARAEGVHEKVVRVAIERGLRRLEKILKNSL